MLPPSLLVSDLKGQPVWSSIACVERCFSNSLCLSRGVAKAVLHCAHRTSTFLSCAFCEQEGHLATPLPSSKLARDLSGMGADWSPTARIHDGDASGRDEQDWRDAGLVYLVRLVYLVYLVCLVGLVYLVSFGIEPS